MGKIVQFLLLSRYRLFNERLLPASRWDTDGNCVKLNREKTWSVWSVTVQQLPEAAHLPAPAAQLLLGLQPRVRVPALPCRRRPFRETALGLLHPRPIPALQPVAVTIRELS